MKLLFIERHNPFGLGGGSFASHAYLRVFSDIANGNIDICMADNCKGHDDKIRYENIFRVRRRLIFSILTSIFTGEMHRFTRYVKSLVKYEKQYDYCVFDGNCISGSLVKFINSKKIKTITIHHNYEPEYFSDNTPNLIKRILLLHHVKSKEKCSYLNSDYNLFLTEADRNKFERVYGKTKGKNYVIGTFEYQDYKQPNITKKSLNKESKTFVITGSLNTYQGIDGIKYFFTDLYKYIPKECNIIIAGRSPSEEVKSLCSIHNNVQLIANPIDMNDVISNGDIYICPTRIGGGLKLRVMDGLKLGLPVITHVCSSRGYDIFYNTPYFCSFNNPDEFKIAVEQFLKLNIDKDIVIEKYRNTFSYNAGLNRIKSLFQKSNHETE